MQRKIRLDQLVHERMPQYSRRQIQSWIMQGRVSIAGHVMNKPGVSVNDQVEIVVDFRSQNLSVELALN